MPRQTLPCCMQRKSTTSQYGSLWSLASSVMAKGLPRLGLFAHSNGERADCIACRQNGPAMPHEIPYIVTCPAPSKLQIIHASEHDLNRTQCPELATASVLHLPADASTRVGQTEALSEGFDVQATVPRTSRRWVHKTTHIKQFLLLDKGRS